MKIDPQFCRVDDGLDTILGKWKIPIILYLLKNQTMRFSDLQKVLPEISKKMLSKNLKELEEESAARQALEKAKKKTEDELEEFKKQHDADVETLAKLDKLKADLQQEIEELGDQLANETKARVAIEKHKKKLETELDDIDNKYAFFFYRELNSLTKLLLT